MELTATTLGVHPLPDDARERLGSLKGHQKEDLISAEMPAAIERAYEDARETDIQIQNEADLDLLVEGQLRWDDMLAHPLEVANGVEPGGIVRYYDNNNFYRDPVITDSISGTGDIAEDTKTAAEQVDALAAVLPGPWTLTDLATNEYYTSRAELLAAIKELLVTEVNRFPEHEALIVPEPSLVTAPPDADHGERVSTAIDDLAAVTDAPVLVLPFYGVPDDATYAHLLDADVGVGFDLVSDHEGAVELAGEYGTTDSVGLGVVNGRHSAVEDVSTIRERVEWFRTNVPDVSVPEEAYLTPNTELFYLPTSRYREKIAALGAATTRQEVRA